MDIPAYQHMNIRMSTRGKRPLRNLTPTDKVRAIQRIHNGETKASVSRDIGVPESTLRGWCKNEQKLRFMCRQLGASEQLNVLAGTENPPEKRPRFENSTQTPKYSAVSSFDEFGYNRLPLNGLRFPSNGNNASLERNAFNELMKKHMITADSSMKLPVEKISAEMSSMVSGSIPVNGDYNSQFSIMQNLNLFTLLSPNLSAISNLTASDTFDSVKNKTLYGITDGINANIKSNTSIKTSCSNSNNTNKNTNFPFSAKNWAKAPREKTFLNFAHENSLSTNSAELVTKSTHTKVKNDSNNNSDKNINSSLSEIDSEVLNFPPAAPPLSLLQIPNVNSLGDSEHGNTTAVLEWCTIFNASLNFLALAAAAAALQPAVYVSDGKPVKKEGNILYTELTKTANLIDLANNPTSFVSNDLSNDSYFESEPEDLSIRSAVTSKLSSPAYSRTDSPLKSNGSCSPLHSDCEH